MRNAYARARKAAFYMEAGLLLLFLMMSLPVLMNMFGLAQRAARGAHNLASAVRLTESAAQTVMASTSRQALERLLGNEQKTEDGYVLYYDSQCGALSSKQGAVFCVRLSFGEQTQNAATSVTIQVERNDTAVHVLSFEKYWTQ